MKKLIIVLLVAFSFIRSVTAQFVPLDEERYADSLQKVLKSHNSDSSNAIVNFLLSDYWSEKDSSKSALYLQQGKALSGNSIYLKAIYLKNMAGLIYDKDVAKSESLYKQADAIFQKYNSKDALYERAKIWGNLAALQQYNDNDKDYTKFLINKAIPLAKQSGRNDQLAIEYFNLGLAFKNIGEYNKAREYYLQGIQTIRQGPYYSASALVYGYLGAIQNYLFQDSLSVAKQLLDKTKVLLQPYPKSKYFLDYYEYESMYYRLSKKYIQSIASLNKGIALADTLHQAYDKLSLLFQKYKTFNNQGDYHDAKTVMLEIIKDKGKLLSSGNRIIVYYELAKTYQHLGDMGNAFNWMEQYASVLDSSYSANIKNNINELEAKYRTSEKEKQILTLQSERSKALLSAKNNKLYVWLLGAGCFILLSAAIFSYLLFRNNKKLSAQEEINHQQQLKEIEQQQQLKITQAMLDGEERERKRMARDLHDGLGGMLAGVKLNLSGMENNHQELMQDNELNRVIEQLDNSISELRRIARNMMPEALLKLGLETALKDLCEFYTTDKLHISFQAMDIAGDIPLSNQINIYRIVQELISNAVKHSGASNIMVQCSQNGSLFLITIEDDGTGFDISVLETKKGLGWNNIKNRVAFLKGKADIHSQIDEGTTINIELNSYG